VGSNRSFFFVTRLRRRAQGWVQTIAASCTEMMPRLGAAKLIEVRKSPPHASCACSKIALKLLGRQAASVASTATRSQSQPQRIHQTGRRKATHGAGASSPPKRSSCRKNGPLDGTSYGSSGRRRSGTRGRGACARAPDLDKTKTVPGSWRARPCRPTVGWNKRFKPG
jgi:hypothetical protein